MVSKELRKAERDLIKKYKGKPKEYEKNYPRCIGKVWKKYLKAGGSLTMINK